MPLVKRDIQAIARRVRRSTISASDAEVLLSEYFEAYVAGGKPGVSFIVQHPRRSLAAYRAMHLMPVLRAELSTSVEGRAIHRGLARGSLLGRTIVHSATAVLALPSATEAYSLGSSKQTLRRKSRAATKAGVTWAKVQDPQERSRILELARKHERVHSLSEYRAEVPDVDDLPEYKLWLVAYSAERHPLLLAVAPVDGEWALLRYFRILGESQLHSDTRYLMTQVLVENLVPLGVRYLADPSSPVGLPNGLRHYQRMLGFRIVRVSLS